MYYWLLIVCTSFGMTGGCERPISFARKADCLSVARGYVSATKGLRNEKNQVSVVCIGTEKVPFEN